MSSIRHLRKNVGNASQNSQAPLNTPTAPNPATITPTVQQNHSKAHLLHDVDPCLWQLQILARSLLQLQILTRAEAFEHLAILKMPFSRYQYQSFFAVSSRKSGGVCSLNILFGNSWRPHPHIRWTRLDANISEKHSMLRNRFPYMCINSFGPKRT